MKDIALLVGNGINAASKGISWKDLLSKIVRFCNCPELQTDEDKPFPLFYEEIFLTAINNGSIKSEIELKKFIAQEVANIEANTVHQMIRDLRPAHIITLNYEFLLEGQEPLKNVGLVNESLYSVFRKYVVDGIIFWHAHGDCRNPVSINLGYEHYGGQLQKMRNYVTAPLRGVLKCHCGNPVTGAPSRGKSGKYFYYYKCKHSGHNNISAIKAHEQLAGAFELMSLPANQVKEIKKTSEKRISTEITENKNIIAEKKRELAQEEELLFKVEEKWIKGLIERDTYNRWHSTYSNSIITIKGKLEQLNKDHKFVYSLLERNLDKLTDLRYMYTASDTFAKRELVNLVFDSNLYYQNGIYRTPTMLDFLSHNHLIMKEKGYLIYEKKRDDLQIIPLGGDKGIRTPYLIK